MGAVVPLSDLIRRHLRGQSTAGLVSITFDDAYASLLSEAADFLYRAAIPATVFVVTNATTLGARYWWDRIDDVFPRVSPERWRAFETACGLPESYRQGQPAHFGPLRPLRQWLLATHVGRWPSALDPLLKALEQEANYETAHRSMTFEELERFAAIPAVEIGVHTVSHPVLPSLSDAELKTEILTCYETLRGRFSNTIPVLAIPFGLFDERVLRLSRQVGIVASLSLSARTLRGCRDGAAFPRFCVFRNATTLKLRLQIAGVMDWVRGWTEGSSKYPEPPSPTT
jgi:peptidoglycan/xylan/chitin deacetylase (PgdA/CDA1 family)